ncbi:AlpA family transcriptional regulator [Novosphingobium sp. BL-8A]|uniref:AlpA family transcriptional regulator n=1 Tax=Novosphingobium sp. BL-8A TaxID=3127639 RepID=UPI00375832C8
MAETAPIQPREGGIGRLLRRKEVELETGLGRSAIYQYMAENRFPKPLKIGPRAVAWPLADIEKWKATRSVRP